MSVDIGKMPILQQVSRLKGLNIVFYLNPARDGWVDPALLITKDVIEAYNKTHPLGAAAQPAAPPESQ